MFKNPFSASGRIRRMEYGLSYLMYIVTAASLSALPGSDQESYILMIAYVPMIWFILAQGAKRCHDRGNSGWCQLIPFYSLWMLFADSEPGNNEYGANPKGIGKFDEAENYTA